MSPPRLLDRYEIFQELARGGMATVHLGRLVGPAEFYKNVAIKRLHPQFAGDPGFVAMFLDEARLAARIHHPNVVQTLDVGMSDGELFVVMEYIDGASLAELMRGDAGGVVPPIAVSIVASVCSGLHAAHEARDKNGVPLAIVHRDVSPQNILVGRDGVARVLDFGIAKAVSRSHTTREGELKGKIAYMSPEQLRAEAVDRRADVYAAAVVLWELLTGRPLFRADDYGGIVGKVLAAKVEPPGSANEELDRAVMKALSVDRDARFATAQDFALALEASVTPATVREVSAWMNGRAAAALERNQRLLEQLEAATVKTAQVPADLGTAAALTSPAVATEPKRRTPIVAALAIGAIAVAAVLANPGKAAVASKSLAPMAVAIPTITAPIVSSAPSAAASTAAPPRPDPCSPPYVVDAKGVKRFKRWCLK